MASNQQASMFPKGNGKFEIKRLICYLESCACIALVVALWGCQNVKPFSLADVPFTQIDPRIDGRATNRAEWEGAVRLPDIFFAGPTSRAGFYYFQSRMKWKATSVGSNAVTTYPGHVFGVAHDIVGSSDNDNILYRFQVDDKHDWNSFEFVVPSGKATIWVFDNEDDQDDRKWLPYAENLDRSQLIPEGAGGNKIDDRGFIVRLNDDPTTDVHWFEGKPEPGDPSWDWSDWHYVFGRHHFGTSFQDVGIDTDPENAVPHEVYEFFAYDPNLTPGGGGGGGGGAGTGTGTGPGAPKPLPWCIWWEWETVTKKKSRRVIVIKDGSPTRATLTQTFKSKKPVLRGQFWLHYIPPEFGSYKGALSLGEIVSTQFDKVMENVELTEKVLLELKEARLSFEMAFQKGFVDNDYNIMFKQLYSAYDHLDRAKVAGMNPRVVADIEVQALSAVATFAAEQTMAIDAAGLSVEDQTLQDIYRGLYDFGRMMSAMADGALEPSPGSAVQTLEPAFQTLKRSAGR